MMKLIEAVKDLKGAPALIPNCSRNEFPEFLKEMGYEVGAEIGVYKGEFTEKLCKMGLEVYAIDPWQPYVGQGRTQKVQDRQDFLYGHTGRVLAPYPKAKIIRKTSMDALEDFKDESLDFVFIDGDHSFRYFAEDICEWPRKVRKGGLVSGHDYFNTAPHATNLVCHVEAVVNTYTKLFNIDNWFIFGELDPKKEPNRKERFLSWMWIKQ